MTTRGEPLRAAQQRAAVDRRDRGDLRAQMWQVGIPDLSLLYSRRQLSADRWAALTPLCCIRSVVYCF